MEQSGEFPEDIGLALVALARQTIGECLGEQPSTAAYAALRRRLAAPAARERHGVFVTLTIDGRLRGCIGSLCAEESVAEGVARHAINAAFHDHRFAPLSREELSRIAVEVSVLTEPQALSYVGPDDLVKCLRPGVDGVILTSGYHSATFLPQVWEQLPKASDFLTHLCLKAGLPPTIWCTSAVGIKTYQVRHFCDAAPPEPPGC